MSGREHSSPPEVHDLVATMEVGVEVSGEAVVGDSGCGVANKTRPSSRLLLGSLQPEPEQSTGEASEDSSWDPATVDSSEGGESSVEEILDDLSNSEPEDVVILDGSINLNNGDLRERVTELIGNDDCKDRCLEGKARELEGFLCSLSQMTSQEKKQSVMTSLAMMMQMDTAVRRRGSGVRQSFAYYLPLIGRVCRDSWTAVYQVSTATITRYRSHIQRGAFSVKPHGGHMNLNASKIDIRWLVSWFRCFAATLGDVVPVRVRTQKTIDGIVRKQYTDEQYTLLPAYFTWDQLYTEMHNFVLENEMDVREPRPSSFRRILLQCCPNIRIRSTRSNVCDVCSILFSKMRSGATAQLTEELGLHTEAARAMRHEYKKDLVSASEEHAVIVMDFSQNLTLPSVTSTPSQWYFLSLINVNVFGIYYANKGIQYNYVYDESTAGKGTDEVNSMLHHFITRIFLPNGHRKLTIYADNCGGQNKNNYVVKMLLAITQMGDLESVELKFFVKGHTKNAVDRGFGHIRKKFAKQDVWTTVQMLEVINSASSSSALVHILRDNGVMRVFRTIVKEAYKDLKRLQRYQKFSMTESKPGVVSCRVGPTENLVEQDLRRSYDGIATDAGKLRELFDTHLDRLEPPMPNFEKKQQMFNRVHPYVPEEFVNDPIYSAPNDEEERVAKETIMARRKARRPEKDEC